VKTTLERVREGMLERLAAALAQARRAGELPAGEGAPGVEAAAGLPPAATLEVPHERGHGDLATNLALVLAGAARRPPRDVAAVIARHLDPAPPLDRVEVAGPGFINLFLDPSWLYGVLFDVHEQGARYGTSDAGGGRRVQVEFVSANPTGPLVIVNARAAAVGDCLANLLAATGHAVEREFYINDAGHQVELLGKSVQARWRELSGQPAAVPDDGYHGEYLIDVARALHEQVRAGRAADPTLLPDDAQVEAFGRAAVAEMVAGQRRLLAEYGVEFDNWVSERALRARNAVAEALALLRGSGHTYEAEGALWFRSTTFGDDKDRVLVRGDGEPTYLAADIAYHLDKYRRGNDLVIDIWGPDHHGYVARMKAAMHALGRPAGALEVLIVQLVRLLRGGEAVRMSKRGGEFVSMQELIDEVGRDAARFFFLTRSPDAHLDFDLDLARLQSNDNPVYYVQYAHTRIAGIFRHDARVTAAPPPGASHLDLLQDSSEFDLLRHLAAFPGWVRSAALGREPHHITRYAHELAGLFHAFYTRCRVLDAGGDLTGARLALTAAVQTTLKNALTLMGVSAPEHM